MECKTTKFGLGLGIGIILGMIAGRYGRSRKARQLRNRMVDAGHEAADKVGELVDTLQRKSK